MFEEQQIVCLAKGQNSSCWVGLNRHTLRRFRSGGSGQSEPVLAQKDWEEAGLGEKWAIEKKRREKKVP